MARTASKPKQEREYLNPEEILDKNDEEVEGLYFRFRLKLGASSSWKGLKRGAWEKDGEPRKEGRGIKQPVKHVPAIHEDQGPVPGNVLRGLLARQAEWQEANERNDEPRGLQSYQFEVDHIREVQPPTVAATAAERIAERAAEKAGEKIGAALANILQPLLAQTGNK